MHAVVLADGDPPERPALDAAWPGWAADIGLVVAADGGARSAAGLAMEPDLLVGDLDSIDGATLRALEARGVEIQRAPVEKDETDTELAIRAALARGATRLTILGAFGGGRLDHEIANIALLALPSLAGRDACLLDVRARVRLLSAPASDGGPVAASLDGPVGGLVSLIPLGEGVDGVTSRGLRYALADEPLPIGPARGLSNVRVASDAGIVLGRGRLLIFEVPDTLER
jgi:thiamine pyrophosphokinase